MIQKVKTVWMFFNYKVLTDFSLVTVKTSVVRGVIYPKRKPYPGFLQIKGKTMYHCACKNSVFCAVSFFPPKL